MSTSRTVQVKIMKGEKKIFEGNETKDNEEEMAHEGGEKGSQEIGLINVGPTSRQDEKMMPSSSTKEMKLRKKKALLEFRCMVEDAITGNYLLEKPKKNVSKKEARILREQNREISLWGVPLLPTKGHEGTDSILLKFLKAKDFRVHDSFEMLRKTLKWRKDYKVDTIIDEDLHLDLENVVYINNVDRQGHPLCYNVYGAFKDKELYMNVLGTEENREKFLRWRIQSIEKSIKQLSFKAGGADSIVQITDLKNSPGPDMKELRLVSKKTFLMLQANYPEIIHKHIMINVPFWYYTSHVVASKLMSQRTKRKFVFVRPSKVTQTLLKYVSAENLPVQYGGLKRDKDVDFFSEDKAFELTVKGNTACSVKIPVSEAGVTIVWDFTVVGWEVCYKEEFIPDDEGSYRILIRKEKEKKNGESARNSFYISEPGKIVLTFNNRTLNKKRVYYRFKVKPTVPTYIFFKK